MFDESVLFFTLPQLFTAYVLFVGLQLTLMAVAGLVKTLLIRIFG